MNLKLRTLIHGEQFLRVVECQNCEIKMRDYTVKSKCKRNLCDSCYPFNVFFGLVLTPASCGLSDKRLFPTYILSFQLPWTPVNIQNFLFKRVMLDSLKVYKMHI